MQSFIAAKELGEWLKQRVFFAQQHLAVDTWQILGSSCSGSAAENLMDSGRRRRRRIPTCKMTGGFLPLTYWDRCCISWPLFCCCCFCVFVLVMLSPCPSSSSSSSSPFLCVSFVLLNYFFLFLLLLLRGIHSQHSHWATDYQHSHFRHVFVLQVPISVFEAFLLFSHQLSLTLTHCTPPHSNPEVSTFSFQELGRARRLMIEGNAQEGN